jgi:hypothetical protein
MTMLNISTLIVSIILTGCTSISDNKEKRVLLANEMTSTTAVKDNEHQNFYTPFKIDTLNDFLLKDFNIYESYQYDNNFKLLFGSYTVAGEPISKHETPDDLGNRLIVLDKNNNQVFRSKGQMDSYILRPKFYKLDSKSPVLILAEIGTEYSWGNIVFSLNKNGIKELGMIELAGINLERDDYDNIAEYIKIAKKGNTIHFQFEADSVIVDPGGRKEKVIAANQISYIYDGHEFKCIYK